MTLEITVGQSATALNWRPVKISWEELVSKLTTVNHTGESVQEYARASAAERLKYKDVGGFVGGKMKAGRRLAANVINRQLLTLDLDFVESASDFWLDFKLAYNCAAVMHSTHSHRPDKVRLRLVIPLDKPLTPGEYEAVARRFASTLGIDTFDPTTFEPSRLMFWASTPRDGEFIGLEQEGEPLDTEAILRTFNDVNNRAEWDYPTGHGDKLRAEASKQQDPREKRGIIGTFCRTYSIEDAIEEFLGAEYEPTTVEGRYTYTGGSTAGGLVTYDGLFSFSHHGTDPSSGSLCNAFDLVRLHKFNNADPDRSRRAMEKFAATLDKVKLKATAEIAAGAVDDFEEFARPITPLEENKAPKGLKSTKSEKSDEWKKKLEFNSRMELESSAKNFSLILANDPGLSDIFRYNEFDNRRYLYKSAPWRTITKPETFADVDYSGVRNYIETVYKISSISKIDDALALEFNKQSIHPVREYLEGLVWDGVERVPSLLVRYFGAEDNKYTRDAITIALVAGVARIFKPGTKFDYVLTLVGAQGVSKSTFCQKLGRDWFSDTFSTISGKESFEQLSGAWVIEMGELAGLRKAEVENIKHFISKREDAYRPAYGRTVEYYPRQCIFIGTTNNPSFLKDPTGNRRFMPVQVRPEFVTSSVWDDMDAEIDQIWAEAVQRYKDGTKLYLDQEADDLANDARDNHTEQDDRRGVIEEFMNLELPANWGTMDIASRRYYVQDPTSVADGDRTPRRSVCAYEVWVEALGNRLEDFDRYKSREINDIIRTVRGWERAGLEQFPHYGRQRAYTRL